MESLPASDVGVHAVSVVVAMKFSQRLWSGEVSLESPRYFRPRARAVGQAMGWR
ncbi:MAG TPA: hypothetical protein VGI48_00755 [Caldimonas sp.]|jgi:hypothetical protein